MEYELYHHGILGMKWGIRRYQNKDGSLTAAGRKRYGSKEAADLDRELERISSLEKNRKSPFRESEAKREKRMRESEALRGNIYRIVTESSKELKALSDEYVKVKSERMELEDEELDKWLLKGGKSEDFADGFANIKNPKFDQLSEKEADLSAKFESKVNEAVDKMLGSIGDEQAAWVFNITKSKRDLAASYVKSVAVHKADDAYISRLFNDPGRKKN